MSLQSRSHKPTHKPHQDNNRASSIGPSTTRDVPLPIKIIDTSTLVHALPVLKRWVREGKYKLIIPLDVISNLDILKTSPQPIQGFVKDATCWLDSQIQKTKPSFHPAEGRFSPQVTGEESSWEELCQHFTSPPIEEDSVPVFTENEEQTQRRLISNDLPRQYRSLLQCALWQQSHMGLRQQCNLVVFSPSNERPQLGPPTALCSNPSPIGYSHLDLTSGACLARWASRFGVQIQEVTKNELTAAKQWIRDESEKMKRQAKEAKERHASSNRHSNTSPSTSRGRVSGDKQLFAW